MYSERTIVIGVNKVGDYYYLDTTIRDLLEAARSGDVLLKVRSSQKKTHSDEYTYWYTRLSEATTVDIGTGERVGEFVFDNGDSYIEDGAGLDGYPVLDGEAPTDPTQGGGGTGGVLVVTEDENGTLDKTWQEIHDAALVGIVVLTYEYSSQIRPAYLYEVFVSDDEYQVAFRDSYYIASSADGYPIIHLGE